MRNMNNHSVTFKKKLNKSGKIFRAYNELLTSATDKGMFSSIGNIF